MKSWITSLTVVCVVSIASVASLSCKQKSGTTTSQPVARATSPASQRAGRMDEHWVQNTELRKVMQELAGKMSRNSMSSLPQDAEDPQTKAETQAAMQSVARLADGLATGATRIPDVVAKVNMSEADRAGFRVLADTLREQSLRLRSAAREGRVEGMQETLTSINATCIACHGRYRDFSGQLQLQTLSSAR